MSSSIAEVALPLPLRQTFTYRIPDALTDETVVGSSVVVPFGNRTLTGFVVSLRDEAGPEAPENLKPISDVLDPGPLFSAELLEISGWMAQYYLCGWGEVLRAAVPEGARISSRIVAAITDRDRASTAMEEGLPARESSLLELLLTRGEQDAVGLGRDAGVRSPHHVLRRLASRGLVELREELRRKGYAGTQEIVAPLEEFEFGGEAETYTLTDQQTKVLEPLIEALREGRFQAALLHGVTSSGKTAVYETLVAESLERGRGALILVPEIAITPQMIGVFRARFGERVALFHSRLKPKDRHLQWRRVLSGDADVVIGPRSAILAPLVRPGVIVVDEEHEAAYKQSEPAPRYNARDVAVYRARMAGAVCVLGSATPSAESFQNARDGRYLLLEMPERIDARPLPGIRLVDMSEEPPPWKRAEGERPSEEEIARARAESVAGLIISADLERALDDRLGKGEQSILFLNRRGFSPALSCGSCGQAEECVNCSVALTYHKREGHLRCHYCGSVRMPPRSCSHCKSDRLRYQGIGTQRVESALNARFPEATVVRMDSDTTRKRGAHLAIYRSFSEGAADILLGTQMVAKGFHFPRVTLVGVISADSELHLPDFRANERTYQLLTQVAGRAGRGSAPGEVIIQSYAVDNPGIVNAVGGDFATFMEGELEARRALGYPPFGRMARLLLRGREEAELLREANLVARRLGHVAPTTVRVLGPAPAPLFRVNRWFRAHVILLGESTATLRNCIEAARVLDKGRSSVSVTADIDPIDVL